MMWTITELKARGKAAFMKNYWNCLLIAVILGICIGGGSSNGNNNQSSGQQSDHRYESTQIFDSQGSNLIGQMAGQGSVGAVSNIVPPVVVSVGNTLVKGITGVFGAVIALAVVALAFLVNILLLNVLEISCRCFFLVNAQEEHAGLGILSYGFRKEYYANFVAVQFIRKLYIFLWSLLLIIPGIIKSYEYRMVPYLLAEFPYMDSRTALEESKRMMSGEKMNAFVLDLSFIGWSLLSAITCGIVGLFYSNPYFYATDAELYQRLRVK